MRKLVRNGVPPQVVFHDLYLEIQHGKLSQIDVVVPTKVGILVFEVKDYSGWIFGHGKQQNWTQVLNYGRNRYYFYNPILQNANHIANLRAQLPQFADVPFYSIIVFYGDCSLKSINFVPKNTYVVAERRVMEIFNRLMQENPTVNYANKREIVDLFENAVRKGDDADIAEKHASKLRDMLGKDRVLE